MTQFGFFVDLSRCIGCNSCTVSCKQWHDYQPGPAKPVRVYQWETGAFPHVNLHMLPVMCYHCQHPACLEACPNGAIYKEEKYGAVLVDSSKCRGNRKCWQACPYGSPQYESDEASARMLKCDMCLDRLEEGLKPICVLSCSMRALEFGHLDELAKKYGDPRRLNAKQGYGPCRLACPAEIDAEGYMTLIAEGKYQEALKLLRETTPFAGVLGRVCTHPCEADCQRAKIEEPVAICSLKRFTADQELIAGREKATPVIKTRAERVAVIGSGPAGLSCAYDLARRGYPVIVFEAAPESGGMMRYGIPEYRLPKSILDNEISYLKELGVEIKNNAPVKRLKDIFKDGYKAVFLASGAGLSQKLGIPGEDSDGVIYALDFLREVNSGNKVKLGKKVVVIGGGSVAIDAARTSLRLGAREVHLVCLETVDLTSRDRMPAQDREIEEAGDEGVVIHPCLGIKKFLTSAGKITGIETCLCTSVYDTEGRFTPEFADSIAPTLEADTVIIAIGQRPETSDFTGLARQPSGTIQTNKTTLETSMRGVFAGGDAAGGPANIISAIASGKRAAVSIDRYLCGVDLKEGRQPPAEAIKRRAESRSQPPSRKTDEIKGFSEVESGFDENTAREQASRCLRCGTMVPSVIFKPVDPHTTVITWDPVRALELWQKRQPAEGEALPDIFEDMSEVTGAPSEITGRNKLVLKAKNSEELLYYTTDNE